MATAKVYATQVYDIQKAIAAKMGLNLDGESKQLRVLVKSSSIVFGVLMKLLVDKGLITDVDLQSAFSFAGGDTYPDEPV